MLVERAADILNVMFEFEEGSLAAGSRAGDDPFAQSPFLVVDEAVGKDSFDRYVGVAVGLVACT